MEQERIRSYRRQQIDPLDAFQIADKNPVAIFTNGPLKVGMGAGQQPIPLVTEVGEESQFGPTLGITLDRNWIEGELDEVNSISITVPPGLKMLDVSGVPAKRCSGGGEQEHTCVIDGEDLKRLFRKPVTTPKTVRVSTAITNIQTVLANAPLAIRSFKATVEYKYIIKKTVGVTVRAPKVGR
jgi:hypothetical protein